MKNQSKWFIWMPALIEESAANCPLSFAKRNTQNSKKIHKNQSCTKWDKMMIECNSNLWLYWLKLQMLWAVEAATSGVL